ncbi:MAG TPA: hypothetical protein VHB54_07625 [Mucilaginibacter sp.]|nr:hypothetical protein [Mucilaginibacter sp.]
MEQEEFYKDQYDRTLDRKNEINASVSTPIGILTALIAGLYFETTNFDYGDMAWLCIVFLLIAVISAILIACSIYHLIKAFSDFQNGYNYAYLNDTDVLDKYYQGLLTYYQSQPNTTASGAKTSAQKEFEAYILSELIKSAGINQKNNKAKVAERFQCHKFMIFALISLSLLIIPFGVDFALHRGKDKVQKIKIESVVPVSLSARLQDTFSKKQLKLRDHVETTRNTGSKTDTASNSDDKRRR